MSPTLDLVNDCLRFVIAFFEVINASAPHIYHSALPLSRPRTPIVYKLHKPHARPFVRVVQGLPVSWKPAAATVSYRAMIEVVAWSPCGRFVAVAPLYSVEVLDAATLERLYTFKVPRDGTRWLCFSPDSRLLTRFNAKLELTSWDLQTGGPVSIISSGLDESYGRHISSTYSTDGKMLAIAYGDFYKSTFAVSTYDLPSRTHTCRYHSPEGSIVASIWTHGECIRFATVGPGSIVIWEVGFTSTDAPIEVERLPVLGDLGGLRGALFLPALSRLASASKAGAMVWDARNSKLLLNAGNIRPETMSFSSDGRFFACGTFDREVYIWKESHAGYIHCKELMPGIFETPRPFISPDGGSIVAVHNSIVHLWRTADPTPPPSIVPTQSVGHFVLEFSPDGALAAVARVNGNTATVLDLKSGNPRLIVDAGMGIIGLRVTRDTIVVVGQGKVVTWTLPAGDCTLNARVNIDQSVQTTMFDYPAQEGRRTFVPYMSISPGLDRVAIVGYGSDPLEIYDVSTGERLAGTAIGGLMPWFTPDGREVWCMGNSVRGWTIVKDSESGVTKLEPVGPTIQPSGGNPWRSSRGYRVTDDWWVVSPSGKRLLWLPHDWRSPETNRKWSGRYLGLLRGELLEAVILELDE